MKSICLYSSFFIGENLPYYVQYYLERLVPHFTNIIYITNKKKLSAESLDFLDALSIKLMQVDNEGYDFGMWGKALTTISAEVYDRIALVNDSCILYKDLDDDFRKINASDSDYIGMVISDRYSTHLQSFFLVIGFKAIPVMKQYFLQHGIIRDYRQLIQVYEIGLTQKMLSEGLKVESLYNNDGRGFPKNPSFGLVKELIAAGMPMIKKKIVFRNFRGLEYYWVVRMNFDIDYRKYFKQIKNKYGHGTIDLDRVMLDAPLKGHADIILFSIAQGIANFLRAIPGVRSLFHFMVDVYKKFFRNK